MSLPQMLYDLRIYGIFYRLIHITQISERTLIATVRQGDKIGRLDNNSKVLNDGNEASATWCVLQGGYK